MTSPRAPGRLPRRPASLLATLALVAVVAPSGRGRGAEPDRGGDPSRGTETAAEVVKTGTLQGDQYLAGRTVNVRADVQGDVLAAGAAVVVSGLVRGDVMAVGGQVEVGGVVADDVRVMGGQVHLVGAVGDELVAAGGDVVVHREATVGGRAMLAGRHVLVAGEIARGLQAAGELVELDGVVGGDVSVAAEEVVVGPRARITGDLLVRSREPPRMADGARIQGRVVLAPLPGGGLGDRPGKVLWAVAFQLGLLLLAWAWLVLAPGLALASVRLERAEPVVSLWFGVAVLFGLPLAALALAITGVGIPLALAALACWGLLSLAGYASTAVCLGDWLRERAGRPGERLGARLLGAAAALAILRALEALPWFGLAVGAGALAVGAGAVARAVQLAHARARAGGGPTPGPPQP